MLLICDKAGRIIYVGQFFCGSQVDFTLFKKELAQFDYAHKQVWVDLGFTGIKNHLPQEQVQIGHKNQETKNSPNHKSYTTSTYQK